MAKNRRKLWDEISKDGKYFAFEEKNSAVKSLEPKLQSSEKTVKGLRELLAEIKSICNSYKSNEGMAEIICKIPSKLLTPTVSKKEIVETVETEKASPVLGNTGLCQDCKKPIVYTGRYWEHTGKKPRHMAIPIEFARDTDSKQESEKGGA